MGGAVKGLAVLGSTGSVGTQTLDIVRTFPDRFSVVALAARQSLDALTEQVVEFKPSLVSCEGVNGDKGALLANGCRECSLDDMVRHEDVDLVVAATAGDGALLATVAAIQAGKDIALANKESVVMAGGLVTELARANDVELLPLDSEPSAIWQCLQGEDREVSRLIITASGGPFRDYGRDQLADVTPEQALNHPTWKMGPKITVDSATLMNKALEVIEAHWLFDVPWEKIEVVVHPQSMIHSMVEFVDGSVKAQISPPDMHLPIQYGLFYPERVANENIGRFDPVAAGALTFERLDPDRYPTFTMALDVAKRGGTWPAVLCGADERTVELFLDGQIGFLDIHDLIVEAVDDHEPTDDPSIEDVVLASSWAKDRVSELARR